MATSIGRGGALTTKGVFYATGSIIAVFLVFGIAADVTGGLPGRLPEHVQQLAAVADDKPASRRRCEGIDPQELSYERVCRVNELAVEPSFAVWGDSHAMAMMPKRWRGPIRPCEPRR